MYRVIWEKIAVPRVQRIAYTTVYMLHIVAGVALAIVQPAKGTHPYGDIVAYSWAAFFILGGIVASLGILPGWNYIERLGVLSLMFGVGVTIVAIAANSWHPIGIEVVIWSLIAGWLVIFVHRLWEIRGYLIAPE